MSRNPALIETLGRLIEEAKPLAERVLSDQFGAEDRYRLRDHTAGGRSNAVFDLSTVLNRLLHDAIDESTRTKLKRNLKRACRAKGQLPAKGVGRAYKDRLVKNLARLILEAKSLAERLMSDDFSDDDRHQFCELVTGPSGRPPALVEFAYLLSALCSETARDLERRPEETKTKLRRQLGSGILFPEDDTR